MNFNEHKIVIVYFILLKICFAKSQTISTIATGLTTNATVDKKLFTINNNTNSATSSKGINTSFSNGLASSPSTLPLKLNLSNSSGLKTLNSSSKLITPSLANVMTQQNSTVSNNPLTQSKLTTISSSSTFSTSKNPSIPTNSSNNKLSTGLIAAVTNKTPNGPNSAVPQTIVKTTIGSIIPEISSKTTKILSEPSTILKNLNPQTSASKTVTTPKISYVRKLNTTQTVMKSKPSTISTPLTTVKIGATSIIKQNIKTPSQTTFANSPTTINTNRIFQPRKALGKFYISLCDSCIRRLQNIQQCFQSEPKLFEIYEKCKIDSNDEIDCVYCCMKAANEENIPQTGGIYVRQINCVGNKMTRNEHSCVDRRVSDIKENIVTKYRPTSE